MNDGRAQLVVSTHSYLLVLVLNERGKRERKRKRALKFKRRKKEETEKRTPIDQSHNFRYHNTDKRATLVRTIASSGVNLKSIS